MDRVVDLALDLALLIVGENEVNADGVEIHRGGGDMDWDWDRNGNVASGNGGEGKLVTRCLSFSLDSVTFQDLG